MSKTLGASWLDYQIDSIEKTMRGLLIFVLFLIMVIANDFHHVLSQHMLWAELIVLFTLLYGACMFCLCSIQSIRYKSHKTLIKKELSEQNERLATSKGTPSKDKHSYTEALNDELIFCDEILKASKEKQRHVFFSSILFMLGCTTLALLWCSGAKLSIDLGWFLTPSVIISALILLAIICLLDNISHMLSVNKKHLDEEFIVSKARYIALQDHEPGLKDPKWLIKKKLDFQEQLLAIHPNEPMKNIKAYRDAINESLKKTDKKEKIYTESMLHTLDEIESAHHKVITRKVRFLFYMGIVFKGILFPVADTRHIGALILYSLHNIFLPKGFKRKQKKAVNSLFYDKLFDLHATFS